ncbi:MAG: hypothetical protein ABI347_11485 [Nitrososphaera sp.]|jgi:hypothetical protein
MANTKLMVAQLLAAAAFGLALTNLVALAELLRAGIIAAAGISMIALSVAAFVLSLRKKSYIVAGLMVATGVTFMVPAVIAMGDFSAIAIPGPILGVLFGAAIIGLGVAKGAASAGAEKAIAA